MKKTPKYLAGYTGDCCVLCGRNGCEDPLDTHHIFNGGARRTSEIFGATVRLCHGRCHQMGKYSVHRNQDVDLRLKQYGQRRVMEEQGWDLEDFRAIFGKNYLDEGMENQDAEELLSDLQTWVRERQLEDETAEEPEEEKSPGTLKTMNDFAAELARKRKQRLAEEVPEDCFGGMA
ncbi:MAG: hypothetical protein IKI35_05630 [Stomatobaculum sp.]|nr:hypothetical protein [Stomatobaculum sp.]MBR7058189.1 hypothetical protein [Stomatobaculum sp.]